MIRAYSRNNQILDVINDNPGLNFRDIMRITGLKNGVVSHYTKKLETREKIHVKRKKGNTRFFPKFLDEYELIVIEMLRRATTKDIVLSLVENPKGMTFAQMIEKLGKAQSTISESMQALIQENVVQIKLNERQRYYQLKKIDAVTDVIRKYESSLLTKAVHNFKDIFEAL